MSLAVNRCYLATSKLQKMYHQISDKVSKTRDDKDFIKCISIKNVEFMIRRKRDYIFELIDDLHSCIESL